MITIDTRDIKKLSQELETFSSTALPLAIRDGLNRTAFDARKKSIREVKSSMVTRNRWTEQSIRVDQASLGPITAMQSKVGSVADYMRTQEDGGSKVAKGSEGVPLATSYSAGQARGAKPRTRMPRNANRLRNIQLNGRRLPIANDRQRNAIAVKMAAKGKGSKYVFLDLGRRKGIFRVTGTQRSPQVQMVHDLTRKSVSIPRNEWLAPAVADAGRGLQDNFVRSMRYQAHRQGLFRG